jgi:DNA-binding NtrC family response regulator
MRGLLEALRGAVEPAVHVLLRGEPGCGQEVLARSLHLSGPRRHAPFLTATCAGAAEAQLEADLFGAQVRGKGEILERTGKLALAHGGTLFLDDVDQLPLGLQSKLLRFLRSGEVEPAGGVGSAPADVRLVAGSREALEPLVARGLFRVDLAYRLSGFAFDVPALRQRREDLPLLIQSYLNRFCHEAGKRVHGITVTTLAALAAHDYPGNLPELEALVRQLVYLCPAGEPIRESLLPERLRRARLQAAARVDAATGDLRLERLVAAAEQAAIREALRRSSGNKARAAKLLGISRNGLAMKMERHGLKG